MFDSTALGFRSDLLAGYQSDAWGLKLEAGYEQLLATHLRHSDAYREIVYAEAKDGWYSMTGGTLQLGLRGGGRLGPVELSGGLGVTASQQLRPATAPFYAMLGSAYAF